MSKDLTRQLVVVSCAVLAVAASAVGSGAFGGTPIQQVSGGALAADATRIAPAGPAFSIWSIIYLGLVALAVWQLLPAHREDRRQRRVGYPIAASMLLNAAWILSVQFDLLLLSVPVIIALLAVLGWIFAALLRERPSALVEAIVVDGTIGLYLGWVCVATAANITAVLVAVGFRGFGINPDLWAVVVVLVAGAVGVLLAVRGRGRLAPAAALCWGLTWVAVARLTGNPASTPTAISALLVVAAVLSITVAIRLHSTGNEGPLTRSAPQSRTTENKTRFSS